MAIAHTEDLGQLEERVTTLNKTLAKLGDGKELIELIRLLHRPGWTTPAEFRFASAIVNAMHAHASALTTMRQDLLDASREVGR